MAETAGIYARWSAYLDRYVQIGVAGNHLISVSFPRENHQEAADAHPLLDQIERYLDGGRESFSDVETALTVDTQYRGVLEAIRTIPYGHERDVVAIAQTTPGLSSDDDGDRARVREALRANPIPLVLPDHRVTDGPSGAPEDVRRRLRRLEGLPAD